MLLLFRSTQSDAWWAAWCQSYPALSGATPPHNRIHPTTDLTGTIAHSVQTDDTVYNTFCKNRLTFLDKLRIEGEIAITRNWNSHFAHRCLDLFCILPLQRFHSDVRLPLGGHPFHLPMLHSKYFRARVQMHHPYPIKTSSFLLFNSLVLDTFKIKFAHKKTMLAKLIIFLCYTV